MALQPRFETDFVVIGTGLAALVAAYRLHTEGRRVLILNPDFDFFLENSELLIDPILLKQPKRVVSSLPENVLETVRPVFPGAIESWSPTTTPGGYQDPHAPFVRARDRLWIGSNTAELEQFYLETSALGLKPQLLSGLTVARKFPGSNSDREDLSGVLIPRLADIDVSRFRQGILAFLRERLGPERMILSAHQIEVGSDGVRFYQDEISCSAKVTGRVLVCCTPRLQSWIQLLFKKLEREDLRLPLVKIWERWTLLSRDRLDPGLIGSFDAINAWADIEGVPETSGTPREAPLTRLGVLIPGESEVEGQEFAPKYATEESLGTLSRLCHSFMKWERFSIRAMRPRVQFKWKEDFEPIRVRAGSLDVEIVPKADGFLAEVVKSARDAADRCLQEVSA